MTTTSEPSTERSAAADVSRRSFLGRTAAVGVGIALAGSVDTLFDASPAGAAPGLPRTPTGLIDVPLVPDPRGILSLPPGFTYSIIAESGATTLESGQKTPADPDGTASFAGPNGTIVLVNNHEVGGGEANPVPALPGLTYDAGAGGGTTNIVVDRRGNRIKEYVSLAGTHNNCAGGITPWDTWLTCEETEAVAGAAGSYGPLTQRHGYVFEVDPVDPNANRNPRPIKAFGRFAHEAVSVDPALNQFYLTEDASNPNGLLYRWSPPAGFRGRTGALRQLADDAGVLEAMRATSNGQHVPDLSVAERIGTRYSIEWVAVPDRDATTVSTRKQEYAKPVTRSRKLEGTWWRNGQGLYVVCSFARSGAGGDGSAASHDGQVWLLRPARNHIELVLRFAYTPDDQANDPDGPDNITITPFGGVIIAEDGEGVQHLVGRGRRATPSTSPATTTTTPSSPARTCRRTRPSSSRTSRAPAVAAKAPAARTRAPPPPPGSSSRSEAPGSASCGDGTPRRGLRSSCAAQCVDAPVAVPATGALPRRTPSSRDLRVDTHRQVALRMDCEKGHNAD